MLLYFQSYLSRTTAKYIKKKKGRKDILNNCVGKKVSKTSKVNNEVKSESGKTRNQSSFHPEYMYSTLGILSFCFDE